MRVVPNVQIGKAQNAVQSLEILHDYWSKIWFRDIDHQAAIEASVPYLPPDTWLLPRQGNYGGKRLVWINGREVNFLYLD